MEKPHPCLTTDWVLGQFGAKQKEAERGYRAFVEAGIGEETIWQKVKAQIILGEDEFIENLIGYVKGHRDIREITKNQRHLKRRRLGEIFSDKVRKNKVARDRKISEAIWKYDNARTLA